MRVFLLCSIVILLMAASSFSGQIFDQNKDLDSVYELVLKSEVFNEKVKHHIKETIIDQRKVDHDKVEKSFSKASSLLNEGSLPEANLYYSKTLYDSGWDIRYIDRYVDNMLTLDYCNFLDSTNQYQDDQYLTCLGLFTEIDAFLRSQAVHMSMDDIEHLIKTLGKISEKHVYITVQFKDQQRKKQVEDSDNIIEQAKFFIEKGTFEHYSQMLLVSENLSRLDVLAEDNLNRDLNDKIQDVLRDEEIKKIKHNAEVLVSAWEKNPENKLLQTNFAGLASSLINNYLEILLTSGRPLDDVDKVKEMLYQPIENMEKNLVDSRINDLVQQEKEIVVLNGDRNFEDALELESKIRQIIIILEDEEIKNNLRTSLSSLKNKINKYNNTKISSYNKFAMKEILYLFEHASAAKNKILPDDKERLMNVIVQYLGPIDTNYLNLNVINSYNDVYSYCSESLNIKQKLETMQRLIEYEKRPLSRN